MFLHHSKIKEDGNLECMKCYRNKLPLEPFLVYSAPSCQPSLFFHCSDCRSSTSGDSFEQKHELNYQVYPKSKTYVLSVAGMPRLPKLQKVKAIEPMNFFDLQVDKLIVNVQSPGYNQNGILYLSNKNLLVACSKDGRIDVFSMGDEVEPVADLNVGNSVKCLKYIVTAKGRSLLAIGVSSEIQIYEMQGNKPELIKILDCQSDVRSFEYVAKEVAENGKLVSVSADNILREWDITTWKCCSERSLKVNNITEPASRILYLRENGMLALNSPNEVSLIKLDDKSFSKKIVCRGAKLSMGYLPKKHQIVIRNDRISVALLDIANDFQKSVSEEQTILDSVVSETTYIANQDETQMIYNKDSRTLHVHNFVRGTFPKGFDDLHNLVQNISAIESIPDQNRLIIGDDSTGTILILRTNLKSTPIAPRTQSVTVVKDISENNAIPLEASIGMGGLFGNLKPNNTSLFSNSGNNGGLFANKTGPSLFANNSGGVIGGGLFSNNNRPSFLLNKTGTGGVVLFNNSTGNGVNLFSSGGGGLFGSSRDSSSVGKKPSAAKIPVRKTTRLLLNKKALVSAFKKKVEKVKAKTSRPAKPTSKAQKVREIKTRAVKAVTKKRENSQKSKASPNKVEKANDDDNREKLLASSALKFTRIRDGPKKFKSNQRAREDVWVILSDEEDSRVKRGRSNSPKVEKGKNERQKSEEKEKDRSQSRSKSASSKKSIHETIKGAKELMKGIHKKIVSKRGKE